jgi:hypothetical protein
VRCHTQFIRRSSSGSLVLPRVVPVQIWAASRSWCADIVDFTPTLAVNCLPVRSYKSAIVTDGDVRPRKGRRRGRRILERWVGRFKPEMWGQEKGGLGKDWVSMERKSREARFRECWQRACLISTLWSPKLGCSPVCVCTETCCIA